MGYVSGSNQDGQRMTQRWQYLSSRPRDPLRGNIGALGDMFNPLSRSLEPIQMVTTLHHGNACMVSLAQAFQRDCQSNLLPKR